MKKRTAAPPRCGDRRGCAVLARALQGLVVVALLTTMVHPAAAQESVDCQPEEGLPVVTLEGLTTTLPQPMPAVAEERTQFVLDLGKVTVGTTATVTAKMSWSIEANDWDLRMEDAAGTEIDRSLDLQPGNPPVEQVSGFELRHCGVFTLVSINAMHAVPTPEAVDSLDTLISVTNVGPPPAISLDDCYMTLHLFRDSAERLSAWIPERTRYTTTGTVPGRPDQAFLAIWFYSCQDLAIDGGPSRATNLSLVSLVVNKSKGDRPWDPLVFGALSGRSYSAPVDADHYLVWAHTDNGKLARHLGRVGMPVERVRSIEFQRPNEFDAFTSVVSSQGSYSSSMSGHIDDFPHYHDNSFWHDHARLGESRLRIQIGSPERMIADDWSCKGFALVEDPTVPPCSRVSAEPGSAIESLLGGETRDDSAAFNHLQLDASGSLISYGG
jgi:hypothetical protein